MCSKSASCKYTKFYKNIYICKKRSVCWKISNCVFFLLLRENAASRRLQLPWILRSRLSQNIADLEKSLGTKLFERSRGEVALTPAGEIFKGYAESILEQYKEAANLFTPLQEQQVSIAASEEIYTYIYNVLLKDFIKVHPEITFVRTTLDQADITVNSVPIDKKRGIFALSSDPSAYFASTRLWKLLLHFLKPTL